jgi:hypothetical protein
MRLCFITRGNARLGVGPLLFCGSHAKLVHLLPVNRAGFTGNDTMKSPGFVRAGRYPYPPIPRLRIEAWTHVFAALPATHPVCHYRPNETEGREHYWWEKLCLRLMEN